MCFVLQIQTTQKQNIKKKPSFFVALTCPLHSCVLLESFSDNTENLARGSLIVALERKDPDIQAWVSCKKETSDSSQVLLLNTSLILVFALLTVRQTYFSAHIWVKNPKALKNRFT